MKSIFLIVIWASTLQAQTEPFNANPEASEHIRQLIQILPPNSQMRMLLQEGLHGDGVRHPWMDEMKRLGIKRALVLVDFAWRGHATDMRPDRILYFDKYDADCSQITDVKRLEEIAGSGIGQELETFVEEKTSNRRWFYVDKKPHAKRGTSWMELFDDEWLPHGGPEFWPSPPPWPPLGIAITLGDEFSVASTLSSGKVTSEDLNGALMEASGEKDDSCIIKPLLRAGADVNKRNEDGLTPLMYAAGAGNTHNVIELLAAGANKSSTSVLGETALSRAQKGRYSEIIQLLQSDSTGVTSLQLQPHPPQPQRIRNY